MAGDAPYSAVRFRRGLGYFISGKGAAALLGLTNFTLVVQLLSVQEYAGYVTIIAAMEVAIAFSTFGLDWAGLRYLPEVREHGSGAGLRKLILRLCAWRATSLVATALVGAALLPWLTRQGQLETLLPVARLYLGVLCAEGLLRFVLGVVFDSLLLQAQGQFSQIVRNGAFAFAVALAGPGAGIAQVARYDLAAASIGLAVAVALLLLHLRASARPAQEAFAAVLPDAARIRRMALHNYASMLLNQPYSPQALLLLAGLFLPAAATAMLGFARNLTDLIRRYQPVEMLLGLIRPLLISTYARQRDFARLARMSRLIYKLSLLTLCPMLVVCTAYGDLLIAVISKQKYPEAYWLVVGLAWTLVLRSHRLLVGTMANILDQPQLLTRTSVATLVVLPICVAGFSLGYGAVTLFIAACVEESLGTWLIVRGMHRLGHAYTPPWASMARMAAVGVALSGVLALARFSGPPTFWLALQMVAAAAATVALVLACGFLDAADRSALRGFTGLGSR